MTKRRNVGWSRPHVCSAFVTGLTFRCRLVESVKDFWQLRGRWLRKTARAAAVPDTLPDLRTSVVNLKAWHLSV